MKMLLMVAAAVTSAALVTPTVAEARSFEMTEKSSATVRFGDLDLSTDKGRAALDRRIAAALEQVCGDPYDSIERVREQARACIESGKLSAAPQVRLAVSRSVARQRAA